MLEQVLVGSGGSGGAANITQARNNGYNIENEEDGIDGSNPKYNTNSAWDGQNGEDCGTVNIYEGVTIMAYGGSGGSGGEGLESAGGGGRPGIQRQV